MEEITPVEMGFERPIAFYPQLARHLEDVNSAIYVQQLLEWSMDEADAEGFVRRTKADIEAATTLSRDQQDTCRRKLEERGYLETKVVYLDKTPILHYKPKISLSLHISGRSSSDIHRNSDETVEKPEKPLTLTKSGNPASVTVEKPEKPLTLTKSGNPASVTVDKSGKTPKTPEKPLTLTKSGNPASVTEEGQPGEGNCRVDTGIRNISVVTDKHRLPSEPDIHPARHQAGGVEEGGNPPVGRSSPADVSQNEVGPKKAGRSPAASRVLKAFYDSGLNRDRRIFVRKGDTVAAEQLVRHYGEAEVVRRIEEYASRIASDRYLPSVTLPVHLLEKWMQVERRLRSSDRCDIRRAVVI